ncbi:hypothetical protein [Comamonas sp.]|uniref:hypothetical protein n=1 Tax=Comamonas sp. TaxID=34028 RepID=UPI00289F934D|nr:hypothetical protein [Comamonas sp.]
MKERKLQPPVPMDVIEKDFLDALARLQAGKPKDRDLATSAKKGTLRINLVSVSKEAGHSRTLIGHGRCKYPSTRDFIVALREDPANPTRLQDVVAKKRVESVRLSRELKLAQTVNATLMSHVLRLEKDVERLQRENKRRRENQPVANLVPMRSK